MIHNKKRAYYRRATWGARNKIAFPNFILFLKKLKVLLKSDLKGQHIMAKKFVDNKRPLDLILFLWYNIW